MDAHSKPYPQFHLFLAATFLCLLFVPTSRADIVCISDLMDGTPTVKVFGAGTCDAGVGDVTASRVTIKPDSSDEFLDFTLAVGPNYSPSGARFQTDLWEDFVGGTLSDVLQMSAFNPISIFFCSDPVFCNPGGFTLLQGGLLEPIENGMFQYEGGFGNTGLGTGGYNIYVQSDQDLAPEPGTLLLLLAAAGSIVTRRILKAR